MDVISTLFWGLFCFFILSFLKHDSFALRLWKRHIWDSMFCCLINRKKERRKSGTQSLERCLTLTRNSYFKRLQGILKYTGSKHRTQEQLDMKKKRKKLWQWFVFMSSHYTNRTFNHMSHTFPQACYDGVGFESGHGVFITRGCGGVGVMDHF